MKTIINRILPRTVTYPLVALLLGLGGVSCTTTYDYYGRPVQSVDPGLAVVGVAAAGLLGYAIANNNNDNNDNCGNYGYRGHGGYYRPACGPRTNVSYGMSVNGGGGYYPY